MSLILNQSVATITKDRSIYPYYGGKNSLNEKGQVTWRPLVPSRDKHKRELGFGQWFDTYQDLLRDPHLRSVDQKRRMAVITRPWDMIPASTSAEDQKVSHFVKVALQEIGQKTGINRKREYAIARRFDGFTTSCYKLLSAYYYGFSVGEIIWGKETKRVDGKIKHFAMPKEIRHRSQKRFGAKVKEDDEYELVLFTAKAPMGESLAEDKFIACFYDEDEFSPLGFGAAPSVYYPVEFKRRLVQYSLAYADRFGSPQLMAKYPGNNPEIRKALLGFLRDMGQEGYGVFPNDVSIESINLAGQGNSVYESLIEFFNREISKTILGETGSTDQQGSGGSRARDQVGNDVRLEIAYADAMLLADTLNTFLIPLIVYYNFGKDVACPRIKWSFPEVGNEEDLDGLAMRLGQIVQIMQQRPPVSWVEEKFGIPLEAPQGGGAAGGLAALFGGGEEDGAPPSEDGAPPPEGAESGDDVKIPGIENLEEGDEDEEDDDGIQSLEDDADGLLAEEDDLERLSDEADLVESEADSKDVDLLAQGFDDDDDEDSEDFKEVWSIIQSQIHKH